MDNVDDFLFAFKQHLKARGRSPATVALYTEQARCFLKKVAAGDIKQVSKSDIEAYVESLYNHRTPEGKPYSTATICVKVRAVKRLFEYLESAKIIFINPAETIREPQKKTSLPRNVPTRKEMDGILDQPNLGMMSGIRDRAILEVLYSTGIRLEELCGLTVFDADLQGGLLRVNKGKGGKDRVVPMGRHAVKMPAGIHRQGKTPADAKGPQNPPPFRQPIRKTDHRPGGGHHDPNLRRESRHQKTNHGAQLPAHLRNGADPKRGRHHGRSKDARTRGSEDHPAVHPHAGP
jgi:site-specific recombinase XerD